MTYVMPNFKTKKALKDALAAGQSVTVFAPGLFEGGLLPSMVPQDGTVYLEGPHYPEPHRWYAEGTMVNGVLVKVK